MILKEKIEAVDSPKVYELYKEISMDTLDGKSVKVIQLQENVYPENLVGEIAELEKEITRLQERLAERQSVLAEIEKL